MKFTLPWLKEHLDTDASLAEIVDKLTMIGLEVENVEDKAAQLEAVHGRRAVISAEKHPNADRLRVCMVDTGDGKPIQVVCGAPNARAGMKAVFAPPGTYIPGKNITLGSRQNSRRRKPRHAASPAPRSRSPTTTTASSTCRPTRRSANLTRNGPALSDPVIEINLTPNRPDCTGVNGIARDLGATSIGDLQGQTRRSR